MESRWLDPRRIRQKIILDRVINIDEERARQGGDAFEIGGTQHEKLALGESFNNSAKIGFDS